MSLTRPAIGSNGWGQAMNDNLDTISLWINNNETAIANHKNSDPNKHTASQISTSDSSDVQTKLTALATSIDELGDATNVEYDDGVRVRPISTVLADIYSQIEAIQAMITDNTDNVTISARVREIPGFISIDCSISPADIFPRFWRAIISKKEGTGLLSTVVEVLTQDFNASRTNVPFDILPGVDVGDVLYVKVFAYFSESDFAEANEQSLTYQGYETPVVERIRTLEEGLTLANIVDAVKNSEEILTLLSNSLQNSTTLARKVAEETTT